MQPVHWGEGSRTEHSRAFVRKYWLEVPGTELFVSAYESRWCNSVFEPLRTGDTDCKYSSPLSVLSREIRVEAKLFGKSKPGTGD